MSAVVVLGAGSALDLYATALQRLTRRVVVLDVDQHRADAAADAFGFERMELNYARLPAGSCVLNLTPASAHCETSMELLQRGHSVYSEKPASHEPHGLRKIAAQIATGSRFAVAPDTHLYPATQAAGDLLASGSLGPVIDVRGVYATPGHERWHPRPFSFYGEGGGVWLDIGPYFLRTVQTLLGPLTLQSVRHELGTRPDLAAPGAVVQEVPLHSQVFLETFQGVPVSFDLAFGTPDARSQLSIRFARHELAWDPVDSGAALVLTDETAGPKLLVAQGPDQRGSGLARFIKSHETDPYFGTGNASAMLAEQALLLRIESGGHLE